MKARIDIRTPAGIPIEGFPLELKIDDDFNIAFIFYHLYFMFPESKNYQVHPKDKIIIEVLP